MAALLSRDKSTISKVELLSQIYWSPEQISLRLNVEESIHISHEYIYQCICADK